MGDLLDKARRDAKKYSQGEFSTDITFVEEDVVVQGLASKHHMSYDPQTGIPVSSLNAHISVNETVLNDAGIDTRNASKQFTLKNRKISWIDASSESCIYLIDNVYPDELLGLLVCTLGRWQQS